MTSAIRFARSTVDRAYRLPAATLVLASGVIHLKLLSTYRGLPVVGAMFLANVIASVVIALALAVRKETAIVILAIGFAASSLVALTLSRTVGLFGFVEAMTPQSTTAGIAEIAALAVGTLALIAGRRAPVTHSSR